MKGILEFKTSPSSVYYHYSIFNYIFTKVISVINFLIELHCFLKSKEVVIGIERERERERDRESEREGELVI